MHNQYITLFKELAQATAAAAETVMDYDREKNDEEGLKTATIMRDDFQALVEKINSTENYVLNKNDAAKLLVGALVQTRQLQTKIDSLRKTLDGYNTDVVPKLEAVVDAENDEAAIKIAEEKFIISDN